MLADYKAHQRPPRPPPRRKAGGASSPLSGGEGTTGRASEPRERALDLMGKERR